MDERVTALETHFTYVRRDMDEIKGDLKTAIARLDQLPTKQTLWNYWLGSFTVALAVLAITIGGIIGGLAWLDRQPPPAPATSAPPS